MFKKATQGMCAAGGWEAFDKLVREPRPPVASVAVADAANASAATGFRRRESAHECEEVATARKKTARVLLFDEEHRLLLMKIDPRDTVRDPSKPWLKPPFWVTLGGEMQEGEDVLSTAKRKIAEETGLENVAVGPAIWHGRQSLEINGEIVELDETFVVARTPQTSISRDGWTADERDVIAEMRWWELGELEATSEAVLPAMLPRSIRRIAEGRYGENAVFIDLEAP